MQSGKSYAAAAAGATARKPQPVAGAKPSSGNSNGAPASSKSITAATSASKKKGGESKGKSNGKDAVAPATAPPGFAATKQPARGFSDQQQRVLRHRALFAFRFFVGKAVEVQLDDKSVYAGVLDCIDPDDFSIVLKNTHRKSESGEEFQSGSTVIFKRRQIAHLSADGVVNYNESTFGAAGAAVAAAGGFRTDTEISGRQLDHLVGRELQAASSWLDPQLDSGELEDPRRRSSKSGWNQFEANEKLFGVVSSFDESIYTTKLDKSKISNQQSREAERIALEIERQTSSNFHLQEERNHHRAQVDDLDEEARYSSVDRKHSKAGAPASGAAAGKSSNSYVPPALRNAQRQSSAGKPQAQSKPASTASAAAPAPTPTPTPAATSAAAVTVPKPLSFSDAVTGRTLASAAATAKPEQKKAATSPKKPAVAVATNGAESKTEAKPAAPASPEKKVSAVAGTAATSDAKETKEAKEPASKTVAPAKETKAKAADAEASPSKNVEKPATAPAKKTTLNPNAKEFKFNVAAAEFTPKFAPPPAATSSPYRGAQQPHHHHHHHHQGHHHQHMGHMHHQPHPAAMGGVVYSPMPDEWMYDGGVVGMEDPELLAPQGYMPYGVPMVPGAVMQPQMYPQMLPQRMMGGGGGQRPHGGGGYGYQQPPYNPRGYYPPSAGVPGGMSYPGAMPVGVPAPQPPLPPREPSPSDGAPASSSTAATTASPSSPAMPPQQAPPKDKKK